MFRHPGHRDPARALGTLPYFAELPSELLRAAGQHADWTIVTAGTCLQRRGTSVGWLWVAAQDPLELRVDDDVVGQVAPGEAFGEAALLLGVESHVDLVAPVDTTAVSLPARAFHGLLADVAFAVGAARRQARSQLALRPLRQGGSLVP